MKNTKNMANVVSLTFNLFQENTYLVYDDSGECVIFDPGCSTAAEERALKQKIDELGLRPVRLINTHCHLDHIYGNAFVVSEYDLPLEIHRDELTVLESAAVSSQLFGAPPPTPSPEPGHFIEEEEIIRFGQTELRAILTPGHSPASLSFYCEADQFVIAGDVLFFGSIGRYDLPGGDFNTLMASIKNKLVPLGDDVKIYPGHGPATSIGREKKHNPFLQ